MGARMSAASAERLARARGETARFESLLEVWRQDRQGTCEDLRAGLLEDVGPHLELIVSPPNAEIVLSDIQAGP